MKIDHLRVHNIFVTDTGTMLKNNISSQQKVALGKDKSKVQVWSLSGYSK